MIEGNGVFLLHFNGSLLTSEVWLHIHHFDWLIFSANTETSRSMANHNTAPSLTHHNPAKTLKMRRDQRRFEVCPTQNRDTNKMHLRFVTAHLGPYLGVPLGSKNALNPSRVLQVRAETVTKMSAQMLASNVTAKAVAAPRFGKKASGISARKAISKAPIGGHQVQVRGFSSLLFPSLSFFLTKSIQST